MFFVWIFFPGKVVAFKNSDVGWTLPSKRLWANLSYWTDQLFLAEGLGSTFLPSRKIDQSISSFSMKMETICLPACWLPCQSAVVIMPTTPRVWSPCSKILFEIKITNAFLHDYPNGDRHKGNNTKGGLNIHAHKSFQISGKGTLTHSQYLFMNKNYRH